MKIKYIKNGICLTLFVALSTINASACIFDYQTAWSKSTKAECGRSCGGEYLRCITLAGTDYATRLLACSRKLADNPEYDINACREDANNTKEIDLIFASEKNLACLAGCPKE